MTAGESAKTFLVGYAFMVYYVLTFGWMLLSFDDWVAELEEDDAL